jgi:hypothetical protein
MIGRKSPSSPLITPQPFKYSIHHSHLICIIIAGLWLNRSEVKEWRGDLAIAAYPLNLDAKPRTIRKRARHAIEYVQELAIRYLQPPTPPPPGAILIAQEPDIPAAPAPPLIIRQAAPPRPGKNKRLFNLYYVTRHAT